MELTKRKKYIFLTLFIISFTLILVGTYAVFSIRLEGKKNYVINAGDLTVKLDETKTLENIIQNGSLPITDYEGKLLDGYNFSLINESKSKLEYTIYVVEDKVNKKTPSNDIKSYLTSDYGNVDELKKISEVDNNEKKILYVGTIGQNITINFNLKMWIDQEAGNEILGTSYSCHIEVEAKQMLNEGYTDSSGASIPVIKGDLVPVKIDQTGNVTKADINQKWYDYNNKEWANAVILEDNSINYEIDQNIPEENIQSYFVWIPRYKYKIFDEGNYNSLTGTATESNTQEIEIQFEDKNIPVTLGTKKGEWLTHPAFTSFKSNGFWVGKFETGVKRATSPESANTNGYDTSNIVIKPNKYAWTNINVNNSYVNGYEYQRELDSHMMKNTEWGAVAYLSHSKYGINHEIRINNNSNYITGFSGTENPTQGINSGNISAAGNRHEASAPNVDGTYTVNYSNTSSVLSSTTGNYSGIYDMSGGAYEYVMGYANNAIVPGGESSITKEWLSDSKNYKYIDKYNSESSNNYNYRILGDATGETGPFYNENDPDSIARKKSSWYSDYASMIIKEEPWFVRGGSYNHGKTSGIFAFNKDTGINRVSTTFRIVLTP